MCCLSVSVHIPNTSTRIVIPCLYHYWKDSFIQTPYALRRPYSRFGLIFVRVLQVEGEDVHHAMKGYLRNESNHCYYYRSIHDIFTFIGGCRRFRIGIRNPFGRIRLFSLSFIVLHSRTETPDGQTVSTFTSSPHIQHTPLLVHRSPVDPAVYTAFTFHYPHPG